jgi:hypothetical protein
MNRSRLLITLVVVDVLLAFGSVGAEGFFGWTLPSPLAEYARHRISGLPGPVGAIRAALLAICVVSAFVSWIGLVMFRPFARRLYLFSWGMSMLLVLFSGPSVRTSVSVIFSDLNALVAGTIIGLVYFSELARRFEHSPVETSVPSGMNAGAHRA